MNDDKKHRGKICKECGLVVPDKDNVEFALSIPLSEYHVRCERCQWPVAKLMMKDNVICSICRKS
jgi:hypothetical protein